jgi:hypothetical protein
MNDWEPPTAETPINPPPADAPPPRNPLVIVLAIVTAIALIAAGIGWFKYADAQDEVDELETEVAELEQTVDSLQSGDESGSSDGDVLDDLLGELGEGLESGDLGDLGGLGDLGELGELFGDGSLLECLGGSGLGGLLGGDGSIDIPDEGLDAQYDAIAQWVEEERGLEFDEVPEPTYVDADEMESRIRNEIESSYPDEAVRADEELLKALGALPDDADLLDEYSDFVGASVAGYYDTKTGDLVVLADEDDSFDLLEQTTIAHELEHALADQDLGFPIDENETLGPDEDAQLAGLALIEGDATQTMTQFQLGAMSLGDITGMLDPGMLSEQLDTLNDAPTYFAQQLLFPYTEGQAFVCDLYNEGGWDTVNAAYVDPPETTAHIMFPDRYRNGEGPAETPNPEKPSGDWDEVRRTTFGAAELMFHLDAIGIDDARTIAADWAGGEIGQWRSGDDVAVRISLVQQNGADLCDPVSEWADALDDATVNCDGDNVTLSVGG